MLERITTVAFSVEIITNVFKRLFPSLQKQYLPLLAGVIGVVLAFGTNTGMLSLMDIPVRHVAIDYLVTGVIVSRGANIVHDFAKKINL